MLQNSYLLAKIGADTAENEQHFAQNLAKIGGHGQLRGLGLRVAARCMCARILEVVRVFVSCSLQASYVEVEASRPL